MFERFYQADPSVKRPEAGTGLGLALVKELLDILQGTIAVESTIEEGSKFRFTLPINQQAPLQDPRFLESLPSSLLDTPNPTLSAVAKSPERPLLLLVEDNRDVIYYLRSCLEDQYQLLEAKNGEEGLDLAVEWIPDLVISDVRMPKLDGFELCQRLKTDTRTNHIPLILLTAKVTQMDRLAGLELGADAYLAKPFQKEELRIRIAKLLELRETLRHKYQGTVEGQTETLDPFLQQLRQVVGDHFDDPDFTVTQLSRALGMSRVQVHRKLKALTDLSTTQYIRQYRLQMAHQLLKTTDLSISEIGYRVGFKDPAHFSRVFSKHFGQAPSETRK